MPRVAKDKTKKANKKSNKTQKDNVSTNTKDDKFSFDEEIVIGLKRIDEPKIVEKKVKKSKNASNKKKLKNNSKSKNKYKDKKSTENNDDSSIIIKSKYMSNYEENNNTSKDNRKKIKNQKQDQRKKNTKNKVKKEPKKLTKQQVISKKKRKRVLRVVKILTLFAIIIGGIIYTLLSPIFNIKEIEVSGNSKISSESIVSLSGLCIDQNIFSFWTSDIEEAIKQNAYIDKAKISRKLPDRIEINVQERVATYMLTLGNAYVYINNQGYILEITSKKLEVPLLIGYNTPAEKIIEGNRLNEEDLEKLNDVLKIMEATSNGDDNIGKMILQIDISDKSNYILDLPEEKKKVYLGDTTDLSTKVLWINKILQDEEKNEGTIYLNVNLNVEEPYFREKV